MFNQLNYHYPGPDAPTQFEYETFMHDLFNASILNGVRPIVIGDVMLHIGVYMGFCTAKEWTPDVAFIRKWLSVLVTEDKKL